MTGTSGGREPRPAPGIARSTGAVAHVGTELIFIVSPHDEWATRPLPDGPRRVAPFGCVGGKLEHGEFPIDAVRREISEETSGSTWHVPGRAGEPYAFLSDGSAITWDRRFEMPGMKANPDWVIVEDGADRAERLLYGFAATVAGDPAPSGGHPALLLIPWRLLTRICVTEPGTICTGAWLHRSGGHVVPADATGTLAGTVLQPIGTASFLCALAKRSPRHPLLAELGLA